MDHPTYLLDIVEACMMKVACAPREDDTLVVRAVAHHLGAGGGRVRALICLHASQRLGVSDESAVLLATVCELLHNASLVQDDLFDREAIRRNVESVWNMFGETVAICAGDLMLSSAFAVLAELGDSKYISRSIQLVFRHTKSVIIGQGLEENAVPTTLAGYEAIAFAKSAALLTLPLQLPLLVSGNSTYMPQAQKVAASFAIAYQIVDDLDDYPEDLRNGALNILSVLCGGDASGVDRARVVAAERAAELLRQCIGDAAELPESCSDVLVSYALRLLTKLEADLRSTFAEAGSMQYAV